MVRLLELKVLPPGRIAMRSNMSARRDLVTVLEGESAVPSFRILLSKAVGCSCVVNIGPVMQLEMPVLSRHDLSFMYTYRMRIALGASSWSVAAWYANLTSSSFLAALIPQSL